METERRTPPVTEEAARQSSSRVLATGHAPNVEG